MTDITAQTTAAQIAAHLDALEIDYTETPDGLIRCELTDGSQLRLWQHDENEDDIARLWAWNTITSDGDHDGSGGLDSFAELTSLCGPDKETLIQWLESGSDEVYEPYASGYAPATRDEAMQLSERGQALCEAHGFTVDADPYGAAYCVEHTIA